MLAVKRASARPNRPVIPRDFLTRKARPVRAARTLWRSGERTFLFSLTFGKSVLPSWGPTMLAVGGVLVLGFVVWVWKART